MVRACNYIYRHTYIDYNPYELNSLTTETLLNHINIYFLNLDGLDCADGEPYKDVKSTIGGPDACEVKPHSKPWVVNLFQDGEHSCGGTLIAKQFLITAAHCVVYTPKESFTIIVGDHDEEKIDNGEESV